ncbi:hypothetical protein [uncultured Tateyamaria sp.]|nr:hypothetical protein [uncultured Tateyamaria sp.]
MTRIETQRLMDRASDRTLQLHLIEGSGDGAKSSFRALVIRFR